MILIQYQSMAMSTQDRSSSLLLIGNLLMEVDSSTWQQQQMLRIRFLLTLPVPPLPSQTLPAIGILAICRYDFYSLKGFLGDFLADILPWPVCPRGASPPSLRPRVSIRTTQLSFK